MTELEDLDEVIRVGQEALDDLRRRRAEVLHGYSATDEDELRELARVLHHRDCRLSHEDRCSWEYEEEEWMRRGTMPGADPWTDPMRSHSGWRHNAKKLCESAGKRPGDMVLSEKGRSL